MHLILTADGDPDTVWLTRGLTQAGLDTVAVTAGELAAARDVRHVVSAEGAWFSMQLPDGRRLDSRSIEGTVNRLQYVLPAQIASADGEERSYAEQEFSAFMLSILACLPEPVLNAPSPQGLCGAVKHPSELVWLAGQAGLPTMPYVFEARASNDPTMGWEPVVPRDTPAVTVYVVGDAVVGTLPPGLRHGCKVLAGVLGQPLLGIDFLPMPAGRMVFVGASPCPPLAPGGEPLVDALALALRGDGAHDRAGAA